MFLKRFLMSIWSVFKLAPIEVDPVAANVRRATFQPIHNRIQTKSNREISALDRCFTSFHSCEFASAYPTISIQSYFRQPHIKENDGSQHQRRSVENCKTRTDLHFRIFVHLVPLIHHRAILSATTRLVSSLGSFIKLGKP